MKTLRVKILGGLSYTPVAIIDGEEKKMKYNKDGSREIIHQTESDKVVLQIENALELKSRFWWITQMFFFFISLFGILNPRLSKVVTKIEYKSTIELPAEDNYVELKISCDKKNDKCIYVNCDCGVQEEINNYSDDSEIRKRKKILLISKISAWAILLIILITFLIIK